MQVRQIDTSNKQDVQKFVSFPFALYRDCAQWVPPLWNDAATILNRDKHPFYAHSTADFFLAETNGQVVGRIAALENRRYNSYKGSQTAFFGYFEAVNDNDVADRLFAAVFAWAKERKLENVIGPRGVIGIDGSVLVEGFEHRPALTIPYNFPYYDGLIRRVGFTKLTDLLSGYLPGNHTLPPRMHTIADKMKQRRGFWVKRFASKREIRRWIPRIMTVHQEAFSQTRSFYPPTRDEVQQVIGTVLAIVDPRLVKLVMKGDEIAGFILAYHDVSAGLQRANGRIWPTGWLHILRERQRTPWLNINGLGLLPQYQGLGANAILYTELEKTVKASNIEHIDVVQVDEANFKSYADMEKIGVRWYKRHRHYHRSL
ncbi:MAG: GNAT family N-acetyltransferase [Anaerolineales bacterium]|nr:GNAT family N-acetyltransferase [Anaerolineales bacterium]